jgi:hypothetical protein
MITNERDPQTALDKATDAVLGATEAVQATSDSVAGAIGESRRPGGLLDQVTRFARETPLRSLAIAFVAGAILARRRWLTRRSALDPSF